MSAKLIILCEDTYGKEFFKALVLRLKKEGLVSNFPIATDRFYGPCNNKLERQMKVFACLREFNSFIVFADADGKRQEKILKKIECHVERGLKPLTKIIIFKYEIEDWLCASKGICIKDDKPSNILKQKGGYEKYRLPDYAPRLDIEKLSKESKSFCDFLSFLQALS